MDRSNGYQWVVVLVGLVLVGAFVWALAAPAISQVVTALTQF